MSLSGQGWEGGVLRHYGGRASMSRGMWNDGLKKPSDWAKGFSEDDPSLVCYIIWCHCVHNHNTACQFSRQNTELKLETRTKVTGQDCLAAFLTQHLGLRLCRDYSRMSCTNILIYRCFGTWLTSILTTKLFHCTCLSNTKEPCLRINRMYLNDKLW